MANVILRVKREDGSWAEIPALVGPEGPQGVSIDDIVLKSQEGGVSTYLILLSDGSEKTFQVTDGAIITDVSLISTDVLIDTYKISISNGSFFNFKVTNGRGIKSIAKTSTDVLSDTYTISYNDNTSSTFKVANGRSITKIVKSNTDVLTDTYTISYNDNTTSTYTVTNGRGIDYIEKDETIGLRDRYTIHYNDGSTSFYYVTNGETGPEGGIGNRIYLSGLVDKVDDEKGYGRVKELKESKFDLSKFTVVGNPTITDDGIASGFSGNNYITATYRALGQNFEVLTPKYTILNNSTNQILLRYSDGNFRLELQDNGKMRYWRYNGNNTYDLPTGSTVLQVGSTYQFKITQTGSYTFTSYISTNGGDWVVDYTGIFATAMYDYQNNAPIQISGVDSTNPFLGKLDLSHFSITIDGKEVFSGNKTGIDTIKPDNYTVNGNPTITDDGIFIGEYEKTVTKSDLNIPVGSNFDIYYSFKIREITGANGLFEIYNTSELTAIGRPIYARFETNNFLFIDWYDNNGNEINGHWEAVATLKEYTNYTIHLKSKDGVCFLYFKEDSLGEQLIRSKNATPQAINSIVLGLVTNIQYAINTNIDLNAFKIYVDGNLVYQPCLKIPYTLSKTGSKIVDVAYRDRVEDCYNQYGAGNYYLFSSATEQFALPMPDIYGLIENLKLDITAIEGADW